MIESLLDYNFDINLLQEDALLEFITQIFQYWNLLRDYNISKDVFLEFLICIRTHYNSKNSFHNFRHAVSVLHISFHILKNGMANYLSPLEVLKLLLAAIGHDMGHQARSNPFEIARSSQLRLLDEGIKFQDSRLANAQKLEMHHSTLLIDTITAYGILSQFSPSECKAIHLDLALLIVCGTDIVRHNDMVEILHLASRSGMEQMSDDPDSRRNLTHAILHCADLGAQTQTMPLAFRCMENVYEEFESQVSEEKMLGIETSNIMHAAVKDKTSQLQDQYNFIKFVIGPLWKALTVVEPNLLFAYKQLVENSEYYRSYNKLHRLVAITCSNFPIIDARSRSQESPRKDKKKLTKIIYKVYGDGSINNYQDPSRDSNEIGKSWPPGITLNQIGRTWPPGIDSSKRRIRKPNPWGNDWSITDRKPNPRIVDRLPPTLPC